MPEPAWPKSKAAGAAGVTVAPTWDANGNLTSDGVRFYTWDARNRLTAIAGVASFTYDAFGRRRTATRGGAVTSFLYDRWDVAQESQGGAPSADLLIGLRLDERFARSGATFLTDALGSTMALASSGAVQTSYGYDPYGVAQVAGAASDNTFQYTGRENDGTGLLYYRARYYNPAWGRFVSEDPIGLKGGVNLYGYVGGNPISRRDPFGLSYLVFDSSSGTLTIYDGNGNPVGTYPAGNNAQTGSRGPWDPGTYDYAYHTPHPDDGPNSGYGSNGNFVFRVPGCEGCGVHSGRTDIPDGRGRRGPQHATKGCIRTTDDATDQMNQLNSNGDPLSTLTVR